MELEIHARFGSDDRVAEAQAGLQHGWGLVRHQPFILLGLGVPSSNVLMLLQGQENQGVEVPHAPQERPAMEGVGERGGDEGKGGWRGQGPGPREAASLVHRLPAPREYLPTNAN